MPLNITTPVEPPEVTALKKKITEVAKKYTDRHGWCDVVNKALAEAGVNTTQTIGVKVDFTIGGVASDVTQSFPLADLVGKTDAEQKAIIAAGIDSTVKVGGKTVKVPIEVVDLTEVESLIANAVASWSGRMIPPGYIEAFTGDNGRVTHLFPVRTGRRAPAEPLDPANKNRVRTYLANSNAYAACGTTAYWSATTSSTRDEDRLCANCTRRATNSAASRP